MSLPIPLRPDLEGAEPYGAPQLEVATVLNVNENPYPPSKQIAQEMGEAIAEAALGMNRYPDREAAELRADLAAYLGHGLDVENVWVANGSNEVMQQLCTAFGGPGRKLLTFTPTYSMYPEYARNTLTEYVTRPRREDHTVDVELILGAIGEIEPDMVVLARPNNPTGTGIALEVIEQVCRQEPSRLFIVDEAYQEFSDDPSAVELLSDLPNLVVSRTMSKAFALAGGRVGYLAASPAIVDACRIVRLPYHLSAQTQIVARVALRHAEEMLGHVKTLVENREEFTTWAREQGFDVVDSQSNFVLLGTFQDRHAVWQELLDRGVLIRETGPEGFLRASAGTAEEMAALKAALLDIKNKE